MTTLTVAATTNFTVAPNDLLVLNNNITDLTFTSAAFASAIFNAVQFGGNSMSDALHVTGSAASTNSIFVNNIPAFSSFSAAAWTFTNWAASDSVFINGTGGGESITGSSQRDFISMGAGGDTVNSGDGNDTISLDTISMQTADTINGGDGTDSFRLAANQAIDIRGLNFQSIENVNFTTGSNITLAASQLGGTGITLLLSGGDPGTNTVNVVGTFVDSSNFSLSGFDNDDTINIIGETSAQNTLIGSSNQETITGGDFEDEIFGGTGDTLIGGASNDAFRFSQVFSINEVLTINGGTQTDKIALNAGTGYNFTTAILSNLERVDFFAADQSATFLGSQLGVGKINTFVAAINGLTTVNVVNASNVNLSTATLTGFSTNDTFNITGSGIGDTITGSNANDTITGGSGADTLIGGLGNDTFIVNQNELVNFDSIDGGDGTADTLLLNNPGQLGGFKDPANAGISPQISNVEKLVYGAAGGGGVFAGSLFGTAANKINTVTAGAGIDRLQTNGSAIDLSSVTFTAWDNAVDLLSLTGTNAADILTGSSQHDIFIGAGGVDTLNGGLGDDTFAFNGGSVVAGSTINGGSGTNDTIAASIGNSDFSGTNITGIERATLSQQALSNVDLTFNHTQVRAGAITTIEKLDGQADLIVNGPSVNLTGVAFINWIAGADIVTINGTTAGDTLIGSSQNDVINGGNGGDVLAGGLGADVLNGGSNNDTADYRNSTGTNVSISLLLDTASGGHAAGDNLDSIENLFGSLTQRDILIGNNISNRIFGNGGDDSIRGEDGNDFLEGGVGADAINGGAGIDTASYRDSTIGTVSIDLLANLYSGGDAQGDTLFFIENLEGSLTKRDILIGNIVANRIIGNGGVDSIRGEGGNDFIDGGAGGDSLNAGAGIDTVSYETSALGVTVDLNVALQGGAGDAAGDSLFFFENVIGSGSADTITGNLVANSLTGGAGLDTLNGGLGSDTLSGGAEADTFRFTDATFGSDTITDWQDGVDHISMALPLADAFSDLSITGNGTAHVVVRITGVAGSAIVVDAGAAFTLDAADFVFV